MNRREFFLAAVAAAVVPPAKAEPYAVLTLAKLAKISNQLAVHRVPMPANSDV